MAGLLGEFWAKGGSMSTLHLANKFTIPSQRNFAKYDLCEMERAADAEAGFPTGDDGLFAPVDEDEDGMCPLFYRKASKRVKVRAFLL